MPYLRPDAAVICDGDVFIQTGGEEIRLAIIVAPLVGHTINGADRVANQQPRFEPALIAGDFIGNELEVFDKNSASRERPFSIGRKADLFARGEGRAIIRYDEPATLRRRIGP